MIYHAVILFRQETGWHEWQFSVYTFQDLHVNGGAEVPPCRLCKLNDSINMFYVATPNQIFLHMCYSSHCNSPCGNAKPNPTNSKNIRFHNTNDICSNCLTPISVYWWVGFRVLIIQVIAWLCYSSTAVKYTYWYELD